MTGRRTWEKADSVLEEAGACVERFLASDTGHHLRNSGTELLKATRSSLDALINFLEKAPPPAEQPGQDAEGE